MVDYPKPYKGWQIDQSSIMIKLKDEVDYNETFVEAYAESDGEVSIELAPSVAADQASQESDGENLEDVAENVESPVVTSSQVLRDFSLRSESRSSQSSYSDSTFVQIEIYYIIRNFTFKHDV